MFWEETGDEVEITKYVKVTFDLISNHLYVIDFAQGNLQHRPENLNRKHPILTGDEVEITK